MSLAETQMTITNAVLATDLDGTLIPMSGDADQEDDLRILADELLSSQPLLIYATGRGFDSVLDSVADHNLPLPDWLICDVGTAIYRRDHHGRLCPVNEYEQQLRALASDADDDALRRSLSQIEPLRLKGVDDQGPFKTSYETSANFLAEVVEKIRHIIESLKLPRSVVQSIDPYRGNGLIDILPRGVSKAFAIDWILGQSDLSRDHVVYAGDSGNDLPALTRGYRAIVVSNAEAGVARQVHESHLANGWASRAFFANRPGTSGLLQGCRWFGILPSDHEDVSTLGATQITHSRTVFRVWAPRCKQVAVEVENTPANTNDVSEESQWIRHDLSATEGGYFVGGVDGARFPMKYRYRLDDRDARPDPASRHQPEGVHEASAIASMFEFPWTDQKWKGVEKSNLIIYELHVGSFTGEGTFRAAIERLAELQRLGITAVELMPVAQSPGKFNWGYDGVGLFAVRDSYGGPDEFKAFVDACHAHDLAVLLDVVYNHVGPEGNYWTEFAPYYSRRHRTPWGDAFDFDSPASGPVRQFVVDNARYWIDEYHLDGLRLDAVRFMRDDSSPHILMEIAGAVDELSKRVDRAIHLIAESNVFVPELVSQEQKGAGFDAIWCDCLMHSIYSHARPELAMAHREYRGASDIRQALTTGFIYESFDHQRAEPDFDSIHESPRRHLESLVMGLQNHDVVGNHPHGKRIHLLASKSFQRAAACLVLLYPGIPLIFMGEEHACDSPFPFFVDFEDAKLKRAVDRGRAREYPSIEWAGAPRPSALSTFQASRCSNSCGQDVEMFQWYQQLIELRQRGIREAWLRSSTMLSIQHRNEDEFEIRYGTPEGDSIRIVVRLASSGSDSKPAKLDQNGELLLSSEPLTRLDDRHIVLESNHAVVERVASTAKA